MIDLTLGGGGARGIFHLGVLHYFDEHNIKINSLCAVSIGAVIGASYACGIPPKQQLEIFKDKEFRKCFKPNLFDGSLLRIDTKHPLIKALIPKNNFEDLSIKLHVSVFDITNAKKETISSGKLLKAILASSSLPLFFAPIRIKEKFYVDGGLVDNLPVPKNSKYKSIVCNLHPQKRGDFKRGIVKNVKRSLTQAWRFNSSQGLLFCDGQITSTQLFKYSILKIQNPDTLFQIGYESAKRYFEKNPL